MSRHRHATRLAVTVLLAAGLGAVTATAAGAGTAGAVTAPVPLPSLPAPSLGPDPVTTVRETVAGLLGPVSTPPPAPGPGPTGAAAPSSTTTARGSSAAATPSPAASSAAASPAAASPARPTTAQRPQAASSTTGVRGATPAASVCLIPSGTASPAFEVGLDVIGHDLSSPLVKQFPQAFAPCPAGAVRADGDPMAAVDAGVYGLLDACVRVTRQVAPVQTSLVVLDQDLILDLIEAGAPVDQLVVPCPAGAAAASGGGGSGASSSQGAGAGASGAGAGGALPDLLAFTGTEPGPVLFAAVVLLCSGAVLVRKARLLAPAARG